MQEVQWLQCIDFIAKNVTFWNALYKVHDENAHITYKNRWK